MTGSVRGDCGLLTPQNNKMQQTKLGQAMSFAADLGVGRLLRGQVIARLLPVLVAAVMQGLLPAGARVVETRRLPAAVRPHRTLVLWMLSPSDSGCSNDPNEPYAQSGPGVTRGCHLTGPTRLSLFADDEAAVRDTVAIADPYEGSDTFDIPYMLERGGPYRVARGPFGKPTLLALRDYNGDGRALEVAMFAAESSSDLLTTVLGYSEKRDRLVQYVFHVAVSDPNGNARTYDSAWVERLFWFQNGPRRPARWKYVADYPGGPREEYDVRYNPELERFDVVLKQQGHN